MVDSSINDYSMHKNTGKCLLVAGKTFFSEIVSSYPDMIFIFAYKKITMVMTENIPVALTEGAIFEIKKLMEQEGFDKTQHLRIGVKGGGCSGMTYVMGFDQPEEKDKKFEIAGIPCVMNTAHEMYLFGMQVDWQDGLNNRGFVFINPNASTTCGCGTSFAV
jgi:iron-sulfur cluster assembly protein